MHLDHLRDHGLSLESYMDGLIYFVQKTFCDDHKMMSLIAHLLKCDLEALSDRPRIMNWVIMN